MERNRLLEMKQADRLRKFIRSIEWRIQEMQFDAYDIEMSIDEFRNLLKINHTAKIVYDSLRKMKFRAGRLLWNVA